jgi:hypothetical protein
VALDPECNLVSIEDIRETITGPNQGNREQQEQLAFIRLMTGYEDVTTQRVAAVFAGHVVGRQSWAQICASATRRNQQPNTKERLILIDKALDGVVAFDQTEDYLHYVVRAVENLRFIIRWNTQAQARGGKAWKTNYRQQLFEDQLATELTLLRERFMGQHLAAQIKKLWGQFNWRHEKVITGRNQPMHLYYTVSILHGCTSSPTPTKGPVWRRRLS